MNKIERAKPILFSTEMVRAILDGRKTVTRRMVKQSSVDKFVISHDGKIQGSFDERHPEWGVYPTVDDAPYHPGDILYVREAFAESADGYEYKADYPQSDGWGWRPSIHMPKDAARIFLRVTDVRVDRLQDITEEQAVKEGVHQSREDYGIAIYAFSDIWNSTIKPTDRSLYGWDANPLVWVIEFEKPLRRDEI